MIVNPASTTRKDDKGGEGACTKYLGNEMFVKEGRGSKRIQSDEQQQESKEQKGK
jgi:hypothetical protein